jgi:hypothetical protein
MQAPVQGAYIRERADAEVSVDARGKRDPNYREEGRKERVEHGL